MLISLVGQSPQPPHIQKPSVFFTFFFILSLASFPQRKMARNLGFLVCLLSLCFIGSTVADWNILAQKGNKLNKMGISLKNYCEGWRMNVELNNIKAFDVVPEECVEFIGKYMTSTQYKVDSERALEESSIFINSYFYLKGDEKDAWIFDVDDTLLSTVPYFKKHHYGGDKLNSTTFEDWVKERKAPALPSSLNLFNEIKGRGLKIFLISSRAEYLREATIDNLVEVGYHGWTGLILRGSDDTCKTVQKYKAEERQRLIERGYRLWGIVADQWSSIQGLPSAIRTYKLPNSMYFVA